MSSSEPKLGSLRRRVAFALLALTVGGAAYLASSTARASAISAQATEREQELASILSPAPQNPFTSGRYLYVYMFAASDCGWSTKPEVKHAVSRMRASLNAALGDRYAKIHVIGVALDDAVADGLAFLQDIDERTAEPSFDEISIGGNWLNQIMIQHTWEDQLVAAAIPQIVLVERDINAEEYLSASTFGIGPSQVVSVIGGSGDIAQWIAQGTPLRTEG